MFAKNQELEVEKEEIVEEKEKQAEEGEGIPLKKEEM